MVTYSLFLDDFADDDNDIVLNEHEDSIQPSESSFDATDADGDTVMQDVQENLKTPSISDVGNVLTMRPCSSVDFFMSPGSSVEDNESDAESATSLFSWAFDDEDEVDVDSLCMSSAGSSVGVDDESDAESATSLFCLAFDDEDELDEDSLCVSSAGSSVGVDDESDADSITGLLGLAFVDEDKRDEDSLSIGSVGSSGGVDDESDADSTTSLLGLAFVDEDELDEDSLSIGSVSSVNEELEVDTIISPVSNVEERVTPSLLFHENEREIGSFKDARVDVFIAEDEDENRARWISLGCQTAQGLSLMFLLVLEQITLRVFLFGCLFMWLCSMVMPGKVGRPIPNPVVYLSCPVVLPRRGVKLAAIKEDSDGEVEDEDERGLRWAPLVPLRGVKLATIEEEDDGDVDEEEPDSLRRPPLVPLRGVQLYALEEEEVDEEQPQEQPDQEDNDDFGPQIVDHDEEDQVEEAPAPAASERSEPTVPLVEIRRSSRIAAKAGKKLILPVGTEGSLFVNGKRRSARLSLF